MGFFIRKSYGKGPFKINLSKSGLGFSTGIKGLRFGIDSKGRTYISGGKGMFRFREYLDKNTTNQKTFEPDADNLYKRTGLGFIFLVIQSVLDVIQSAIFIGIFSGIAQSYNNSYVILTTLILCTVFAVKIHKIIFTPRFIKMVNYSTRFLKHKDYTKALEILNKSKQIATTSKIYIPTTDFLTIINNLIKICSSKENE